MFAMTKTSEKEEWEILIQHEKLIVGKGGYNETKRVFNYIGKILDKHLQGRKLEDLKREMKACEECEKETARRLEVLKKSKAKARAKKKKVSGTKKAYPGIKMEE